MGKKYIFIVVFIIVGFLPSLGYGQCGPNVPSVIVNLSSNPNTVWVSPTITRADTCCGSSAPDKCVEFIITLHPGAQGIIFNIASGAVPPGALFYQIGCGPPTAVGAPVCLSGAGPHYLTFCKPGNNSNTYTITSISAPGVGPSVSINDGCNGQIYSSGYDPLSINWTSITGGIGVYDSYMNCTTCDSVELVAQPGFPPFVDFQICGLPLGSCDTNPTCDTVRAYFHTTLIASILPINPTVCFGALGTTITANGSGGTAPYNYLWSTGDTTASIFVNDGIYYVTLGDSSGCPPTYDTVVVTTFANVISANAGVDQVVCTDDVPLNLMGTVVAASGGVWSGGNGTYSPNDSSLTASYLPTTAEINSGTMVLYLTTTGNGSCPPGYDTVQLTFVGFDGAISSNSTPVSCNGGNDGSASVTLTGGTNPYTYSWNTSPIQTTNIVNGLSAGTYAVNITNGNGCDSLVNITVIEPTVLSSSISGLGNVNCTGGNDGFATVSGTGGVSPYGYIWDSGAGNQATSTAINLFAGTYTVTITDAAGCITIDTVIITEPAYALGLSVTPTDITCFGLTNGSVTATPSGGTLPYSYAWSSSSQTTSTISNLGSGVTNVTVTDNNGWCVVQTGISIIEPPVLNSLDTVSNVTCFGGANGTATIIASGGVSPYTYSWGASAGNQTSATAIGLDSGTYAITITDSNGCVFDTNAWVNHPLPLATTSLNTPVSCFGGSNGTVGIIPSGGTPPYNYNWGVAANSQTTAIANSLLAGNYLVTVTDSNGCQLSANVSTSEPTILTSNAISINSVGCFGDSSGLANVLGFGGTAPYSYVWNAAANGQLTGNATNLGAGTFAVTVTDTNGCVFDTSIVITQPILLVANETNNVAVSCYGGANGTATVTGAGGTLPYSYLWPIAAGGQTTSIATNLLAGNYIVTVTDSNACEATITVIISEPLFALSDSITTIPVSCFGGNDGMAISNPSGGTAPYSYSWSTNTGSQTSVTAIGLDSGTYAITITDSNGCVFDTSAWVNHPLPLATTSLNTPVSCFGGSNGTVGIIPSGGTPPYNYNWGVAANSQTTAIANSLLAGNYLVTVTDSNGCQLSANVSTSEPTILTSNAISINSVGCFGDSSGLANVLGFGGTAPYSYVWNAAANGQLTGNATNLGAGTFAVTITDTNGCVFDTSIVITQPILLVANETNNVAVSCYGGANGTATVTGAGGTLPYSYLWPIAAGGQTTSIATNLLAGNYIVTVTDSNACEATITVIISEPLFALSDTIITFPVSCFGGNDGAAISIPSGGTAPYSYFWGASAGNQINDTATALIQGTYAVTVTDANGCTIATNAVVIEPSLLDFSNVSQTNVNCFGGMDGTATVVAMGGNAPYSYAWSANTGSQINPTATNLLSGSFSITVTDASGCQSDTTIIITQPAIAMNINMLVSNVNCFGGSDGTASVVLTGGTAPYTINWNAATGNQTTPTATNLSVGNYQVIVSDSNGCMDTNNITVSQPNAPLGLITSSISATCNGFSDGQATVSITGGTSNYAALWDNTTGNQTNTTATGLMAGLYSVIITDANGCMDSSTVTVNEPNPITISVSPDDTVCTQANFNVGVNATGGNGAYNYTWNNGLSNTDLHTTTTVNSNVYTVSVTDVLGCPGASDSINITVFNMDPDSLTAWSTGDVCLGDFTTIEANYAGLNPPYSYQWSHGLGQGAGPKNVSPSVSTIYQVTVTDVCNSVVTEFVIVNLLQAPIINTPNVIDEGCGPLTVSFADNINDGGNPTYVWNFGDGNSSSDSTPVHTYTNSGTYHITVTKTTSLGCSATSSGQSVVVVYPFPIADAMADKYVTDENNATINFTDLTVGATSIKWEFSPVDFSFISNPSYTYPDTGTYLVLLTAENQYGCVSDFPINIIITPAIVFDVPNAFMPDPDGGNGGSYDLNSMSNAVFFPRTEYVADFHMTIFNRWGEMVFESNDVTIGWDGYYRGKLSAQDVYVWKIDIVYVDGSQISEVGDLTLIK